MLVPVDSTKPGIISFWPILIKLFCKLFTFLFKSIIDIITAHIVINEIKIIKKLRV